MLQEYKPSVLVPIPHDQNIAGADPSAVPVNQPNLLFPGASVVGYGPYSYHYTQIQDVQGVNKQVG